MSEKNDDSIEEFFRKAVRQTDTSFRDHDWSNMEKRLNEQAALRGAGSSQTIKRIAGGATGAVLVLLGIYLYLYNGQDTDKKNITTQQAAAGKGALERKNSNPAASLLLEEQQATSEQKNTEEGQIDALADSPSSSSQEATTIDAEQKETNVDLSQEKHKKVEPETTVSNKTSSLSKNKGKDVVTTPSQNQLAQKRERDSNRNSEATSDNDKTRLIRTTEDKDQKSLLTTSANPLPERLSNSKNVDKNNKEGGQNITVASTSKDENEIAESPVNNEGKGKTLLTSEIVPQSSEQNTEKKSDGAFAQNKGATDQTSAPDSVNTMTEDTVHVVAENEKKEGGDDDKEEQAFKPRWSAALVVAPDFSSTSFGKMTAPGGAYGLMIGYRIFNKVTLTAGVLKTSKKYEGSGADYHPPYGYWEYKTNGVVPDKVYGQCAVVEVPIVIQYDIHQRTKYRIYVASGLSSYRMLSESYDYSFNEPNPGADTNWSSDTPSSYAFSVGHISAGYERKLYQGLSFGIEPYVKIPFKGIGWSSVNLFTTGLYLNARYRF